MADGSKEVLMVVHFVAGAGMMDELKSKIKDYDGWGVGSGFGGERERDWPVSCLGG